MTINCVHWIHYIVYIYIHKHHNSRHKDTKLQLYYYYYYYYYCAMIIYSLSSYIFISKFIKIDQFNWIPITILALIIYLLNIFYFYWVLTARPFFNLSHTYNMITSINNILKSILAIGRHLSYMCDIYHHHHYGTMNYTVNYITVRTYLTVKSVFEPYMIWSINTWHYFYQFYETIPEPYIYIIL